MTVEVGGLKKFAQALETWWSNERGRYHGAPAMKVGTIENRIAAHAGRPIAPRSVTGRDGYLVMQAIESTVSHLFHPGSPLNRNNEIDEVDAA